MIAPLPKHDDESWGDGYRDTVELRKPDHVHKLRRSNGNRLECLCGWSLKVTDPRLAEDVISKVNGLQEGSSVQALESST